MVSYTGPCLALLLLTSVLVSAATANQADISFSEDVSLLQQSLQVEQYGGQVVGNAPFGASLRASCLEIANRTECMTKVHQVTPNSYDGFSSCISVETGNGHVPIVGGTSIVGDIGTDATVCGATRLFYRSIWKSASSSIQGNLEKYGDSKRWTFNSYSELEDSRSTSTLFTFVREPISRFISGYAEIESKDEWQSSLERGSEERARAFVNSTVAGEIHNMHVGLQINFLTHSYDCLATPFDFIGRLENFDDDWDRLAEIVGCELAWDNEIGEHSHPPTEAADPMREVLSDGDVMRSVCQYYLPDFAIFEYQLPDVCADMYDRAI